MHLLILTVVAVAPVFFSPNRRLSSPFFLVVVPMSFHLRCRRCFPSFSRLLPSPLILAVRFVSPILVPVAPSLLLL